MSRYFELRRELQEKFSDAGIESAGVEADILISELAQLNRVELFLHSDDDVAPELEKRIRTLGNRRVNREPLQYLLGYAYFMDLKLNVSPDVLIPRPETERLVEWVIEFLPKSGSLLDLGTGSGAIALSVAQDREDAVITAVDISPNALAVARHNAEKLCFNKVHFVKSNLFKSLKGETFDLIAANLPYVTDEEYASLAPEVRCYEPRLALTAPDSGFDLIRRAALAAATHLKSGGRIIFELAPSQVPRLAELLGSLGNFREIVALQDYTRRERFVTARLKS
ncbi:MAG: peptide chain release factor N(5)-glutamine methyltransferase [Victivallales bacterium]|jgi:release factor glutamine methyltransferase|nr:peptide chain release factor N(5)-glutamine methyltransferase [Victivallales bacterium]